MRGRVLCVVVLLAAVMPCTASAAARPFEPRFSANDTGDITIAANTLLTCSPAEAQCAAAQAGTATGAALNNNGYVMQHVNADPAPAPVPVFGSSSAQLDLPAGATVLRALLYFGADSSAGAAGGAPPNAAARDTVLLKAPGQSSYQSRTAPQLDFITTDGNDFQGVVDVTGDVAEAGRGSYSVANVQAGTGRDRQAGWALVVAYRDTSQPPRNLSIFDGFQVVNSGNPNVSIPVSGFETPLTGPVRTEVGFVAYEGDRGSTGDTTKLNTTTLGTPGNYFASNISRAGVPVTTKNPSFGNQLGYDASLARADGVLANGANSAVIRLTTGGEAYFPGVVTFATELFAPDVQLAKSVLDLNGGQVEPGDVLRYTVTATNPGGDDATNVAISDPIPTHTAFVPGSLVVDGIAKGDGFIGTDEAGFDVQNNRAVFWVGAGASAGAGGTLAAGTGTATVSFDVTVDTPPATIPPGTEIANAAHADFFARTLGVPLGADSNTVTSAVAAPDLTIAKDPSPFNAVGGATQGFMLTVTNSGNTATDGSQVTVTDTPPGTTFSAILSASGIGWSCTPGPVTIICTRAIPDVLAAGASYPPIQVDLQVVAAPPVGAISNTASVSGGGDADPTNNSGTAVGQATTRADLQILKTADAATALTGERVTFTLRVRNGGPSPATGVVVSDPTLGTDYNAVSAGASQGSCTSLAPVTCALGTMAAGAEATVTIVATVTATGAGTVPATNSASVSSATVDPDPTNDSAQAVVDVPPTADLNVAKAASPDPLDAPGPATYTLTVGNDGPQSAAGVTVTDPLPAELTGASATPSQGSCDPIGANNTLICDLGTIASGAGATITISGTLAAAAGGGFLSNSASVTALTGDPDPTDDGVTDTTLVTPAADVELTKLADNLEPVAGGNVTFTIELTNHGPSVAQNARLTDTLPAGLALVSAPGCTSSGGTLTCVAGTLAAGQSRSFPITARVTGSAAGSVLTNVAAATSDTPDPIDANNSDAATVTAVAPLSPGAPSADLVVSKRALDRARVGRRLRYAVTVENRGSSTASGVTAVDALSGRLDFVSANATQGGCSGTRTVTCALGSIAAGARATITLTVKPRKRGSIENSATVASATPDPVAANNVAGVTVRSRYARTRVRVRKRADRESLTAGGVVAYRITVRNTGAAAARRLRVCDRLGSGLAFVTKAGAKLRDGQACWTVRRLARGKSRTYRVLARTLSVSAPRSVTNRARVTGANVAARAARARVRVRPVQAPAGGVTG